MAILLKEGTSDFQRQQKAKVNARREAEKLKKIANDIKRKGGSANVEFINGKPMLIQLKAPDRYDVTFNINGKKRILTNVTQADIIRERQRTQRSLQRNREEVSKLITRKFTPKKQNKQAVSFFQTSPSLNGIGSDILLSNIERLRQSKKVPIPQKKLSGVVGESFIPVPTFSELERKRLLKKLTPSEKKLLTTKAKDIKKIADKIQKIEAKNEEFAKDLQFGLDKIGLKENKGFAREVARFLVKDFLLTGFNAFAVGRTINLGYQTSKGILQSISFPEVRKAINKATGTTRTQIAKSSFNEALINLKQSYNPKTPQGVANILGIIGIALAVGLKPTPNKAFTVKILSKELKVSPKFLNKAIGGVSKNFKRIKGIEALSKSYALKKALAQTNKSLKALEKQLYTKKGVLTRKKIEPVKITKLKTTRISKNKNVIADKVDILNRKITKINKANAKLKKLQTYVVEKEIAQAEIIQIKTILNSLKRTPISLKIFSKLTKSINRFLDATDRFIQQNRLLSEKRGRARIKLSKTKYRKQTRKIIIDNIKRDTKALQVKAKMLQTLKKEFIRDLQKAARESKELKKILDKKTKSPLDRYLPKKRVDLEKTLSPFDKVGELSKSKFGKLGKGKYKTPLDRFSGGKAKTEQVIIEIDVPKGDGTVQKVVFKQDVIVEQASKQVGATKVGQLSKQAVKQVVKQVSKQINKQKPIFKVKRIFRLTPTKRKQEVFIFVPKIRVNKSQISAQKVVSLVKNIQKPKVKQVSKQVQITVQKPKVSLKTAQKQKTVTKQKTITKAKSRVIIKRKPTQSKKPIKTIRKISQITRKPRLIKPKPKIKLKIPFLFYPKFKKGTKARKVIDKIRLSIPSEYRPSLEAIVFGIVSNKKLKRITGVEIRPIIEELAQKKKKRILNKRKNIKIKRSNKIKSKKAIKSKAKRKKRK